MKMFFVMFFASCWSASIISAQEWLPTIPAQEPLPTIRILPEDVVQASTSQLRGPRSMGTNEFNVRWTYTGIGAKKALAFWREHAGEEVLQIIGDFEFPATISTAKMPGWTEEGWLKRRTDKFMGVSEGDAKKIVAGLRGK